MGRDIVLLDVDSFDTIIREIFKNPSLGFEDLSDLIKDLAIDEDWIPVYCKVILNPPEHYVIFIVMSFQNPRVLLIIMGPFNDVVADPDDSLDNDIDEQVMYRSN